MPQAATPLNGNPATVSPVSAAFAQAQRQVLAAIKAQGADPANVAFSAYVNGIMQSARITALYSILERSGLTAPAITATGYANLEEYFTALTTEVLVETLPALEAHRKPSILVPGARH